MEEVTYEVYYKEKMIRNGLAAIVIGISFFCFIFQGFYDLMWIVAIAIVLAMLQNWAFYAKYGKNI